MIGFRTKLRSEGRSVVETAADRNGGTPSRSSPRALAALASLFLLVVVLAGCGEDDSGEDAAVAGASDEVEAFCTELNNGDFDFGFDGRATVGDLSETFLALERNAPDEVASDISTITSSFEDLSEALADAENGDDMPLEAALAAAEFDDPNFQEAVRNVQSYAQENCDAEG